MKSRVCRFCVTTVRLDDFSVGFPTFCRCWRSVLLIRVSLLESLRLSLREPLCVVLSSSCARCGKRLRSSWKRGAHKQNAPGGRGCLFACMLACSLTCSLGVLKDAHFSLPLAPPSHAGDGRGERVVQGNPQVRGDHPEGERPLLRVPLCYQRLL